MALFNSKSSGNNIRLSATDRHHQRPVSEILKPENFISPESKVKIFILLIPHLNLYFFLKLKCLTNGLRTYSNTKVA